MAKTPAIRANVIRDSKDFMLGIAFREGRQTGMEDAITRAKAADRFVEQMDGKVKTYAALFSEGVESAERAADLLGIVHKWPGVQVFVKGRLIMSIRELNQMLECYLKSFRVRDYKAHCHKVIKEPGFDDRVARIYTMRMQLYDLGKTDAWVDSKVPTYIDLQRYVHPCALIAEEFAIDQDHPSEFADQVQAHAVRACVDLCPKFHCDEFKHSGKPVKVDVFDVD